MAQSGHLFSGGGLHGVAQIFETFIFPNARKKSLGIFCWLRIGIVFIFCSFAWIFFISNTIGDAVYVVTQMLNGISSPITYLQNGFVSIGMDKFIFLEKTMVLLLLAVYDYLSLKRDVIAKIGEKHKVIRWSVYVCFGLILIFFSQKGVAAEFVYFQF